METAELFLVVGLLGLFEFMRLMRFTVYVGSVAFLECFRLMGSESTGFAGS